jgi:hypothetical protein
MNLMKALGALLILFLGAPACTPAAKPMEEVLSHLDDYLGEKIVVRTRLRSGARCRVGKNEGDFKTYCRDCQFCKGPLVVDAPGVPEEAPIDDWPLVLGGTHEGQPIRCEGKLEDVKCHPFDLAKTYVIRGSIERTSPPKLLVSEFWEAD